MQFKNGFQSLIAVGKQPEVIQLPRFSSFASDFGLKDKNIEQGYIRWKSDGIRCSNDTDQKLLLFPSGKRIPAKEDESHETVRLAQARFKLLLNPQGAKEHEVGKKYEESANCGTGCVVFSRTKTKVPADVQM
jgi:hypothetical protein